ncbi:YaiI/YqxD family protein [Hoeflea sp. G2-23]|uniref:UPF0178 protein OEG84_20610 n=1 Tax=Hoeflea algicola TaxID=2983763 RepID=A0ABT3ZFM9_9HYPH|nr:YaiI/YqxD family protein [Hoeflea algicola]MCY0150036.1 YaiI/YqxD family protein [Hoeflea algicola]
MTQDAPDTPPLDTPPIHLLVDADACPVREQCVKVALRHGIKVTFISNSFIRIEDDPLVEREIVPGKFDAADDRIVEHVTARSVVVTADILLAERCLKADAAAVLSPIGKPFTHDSIGMAVATRSIMADLRAGGAQVGGPAAFSRTDRSRFLSALDLALVRLKRHG